MARGCYIIKVAAAAVLIWRLCWYISQKESQLSICTWLKTWLKVEKRMDGLLYCWKYTCKIPSFDPIFGRYKLRIEWKIFAVSLALTFGLFEEIPSFGIPSKWIPFLSTLIPSGSNTESLQVRIPSGSIPFRFESLQVRIPSGSNIFMFKILYNAKKYLQIRKSRDEILKGYTSKMIHQRISIWSDNDERTPFEGLLNEVILSDSFELK